MIHFNLYTNHVIVLFGYNITFVINMIAKDVNSDFLTVV